MIALALLLSSPALSTGLSADDFFHRVVLTGRGDLGFPTRDPLSMFVWANGDPARARAMREVGVVGWWSDPTMVMAFFRPLAVATHWLDYRLWPDQPWLMHLHSLLWFALGLRLLSRLYLRLLSFAGMPFLPGLALFLYAVDDAHGMTLGWLANRNSILAFVLGLAVLLLHDRRAREGDLRAGRVAPLVLLIALLAGESALAVTGYLFAHALYVDPAPRAQALRRLLPYAGVVAVWSLVYRSLGYGARGSGLVVDPGSEPLRFLAMAAERVPVLLSGQLAFPPSDGWEAYQLLAPWLPGVMFGVALASLAILGLAFAPGLREHGELRFFGLGALLAAVPVSAQFPHDRLLLFIGIGAMPLVARVLAGLIEPSLMRPSALGLRGQRIVAYGCALLHLGVAPLWLPFRVRAPLDGQRMIEAATRSIDASPAVRDKTVVLLNPPVDAYAGFLPPMREARNENRPRGLRWLATGGTDLRFDRLDARTLRVRPKDGFLSLHADRMQRDPKNRMQLGERVEYSDLTIEVTALTRDGRPAEILARFALPLEDPHYELYAFRDRRFVHFTPPAVGQSVFFPRVDFKSLLQ